MPIDPNEAPEGTLAVEHPGPTCPGEICIFYGKKQCADQTCYGDDRKDKTGCYFIKNPQPTEMKPMESEHEYLDADSLENCKKILEWIFADGCEMKRTVVSKDIIVLVEWESASGVLNGREYRRKKPHTDVFLTDPKEISRLILEGVVECMQGTVWLHATVHDTNFIATKLELGAKYRLKPGCKLLPKKTKKLVPRTAEEFWPLIGKWWFRHKNGEPRRLITSSDFSKATQEYWEIAPLGSEEWRPMMKEVEGEE